MDNGEIRMENREWIVDNGYIIENGEIGMENREWRITTDLYIYRYVKL